MQEPDTMPSLPTMRSMRFASTVGPVYAPALQEMQEQAGRAIRDLGSKSQRSLARAELVALATHARTLSAMMSAQGVPGHLRVLTFGRRLQRLARDA